ncbi:protein PHOSPHATE STARVATION RESPONSE 2-like [Vicia villosa]|uniref:protein PHOSPHATE STARVATION RESPONSE 2-like n=1 Tax=Vicia villosa TaxID=3911 RepID=UPI00273B09C2|nr:protein PHOSPHATE STARVATION RESPONSE 2-like [Vicia villosa]
MYTNQWELYEHESFEPFSILTPLEDITTTIHESNVNETYMSFQPQQHYQQQIDIPIWSNEFSMKTTTESPFQFCQENYSNIIAKQDQQTTSLDFVAESLMSISEDSISYSEKCSQFASCSDNTPICENFPQQHKKVLEGFSTLHPKSHEMTQLESCINQNKQQSSSCGVDFATATNSVSKITAKGKRRLIWTKEMHEPFVIIVSQLGGPEKAKPKAILQMMGLDELNISHVKSHLQS